MVCRQRLPCSPGAVLTVPAGLVCQLRVGLHVELGAACETISQIVNTPGREEHAECYQEPLKHLDAARWLLEVIGWANTGSPTDVEVDLREHRWVLLAALESQLESETYILDDLTEHGRERGDHSARVKALREFATEARATPSASTPTTARSPDSAGTG